MAEDEDDVGQYISDDAIAAGLRRKLGDALADGLAGEVVTRWVTIAEVLDEDGARVIWSVATEGVMTWDVLGLLEYGKAIEQATLVRGGT